MFEFKKIVAPLFLPMFLFCLIVSPFILVTSASHMSRAVALFKNSGLSPIPAPCGHLGGEKPDMELNDFYPRPQNLYKAERALHEYLGIILLKIKSAIQDIPT